MAQKEVIYAGDITPAKSLIGLLDGTEMFCVENPWFVVPGMRPIDKKTYMELKPSKASFGVMLSPVYLLVRTMDRKPFNSKFVIGYTNARGERKNYFVMKEYDISKIRENVRHKLIVSPGADKQISDENLIKLDQQLCMVMDVLLIAKIMDMDMKVLCSEECKGLCPVCGKNLNLGPCGCRKQPDPRFAVLEQLLDK